ncbi:hypothetical protein GCM10009599_01220 [Luteococcus peritonei]
MVVRGGPVVGPGYGNGVGRRCAPHPVAWLLYRVTGQASLLPTREVRRTSELE